MTANFPSRIPIVKTDGTSTPEFSRALLALERSAYGAVLDVGGTSPIVSTGGTTPVISILAANAIDAGSMSAADKIKLDAISGANTGDQTAATVPNTPSGGIAAVTVQDALNELDTEKVPTTRTVNGHALAANVVVTAADVGLGSVDNTADSAKPVSTAQQTALNTKAAENRLINGTFEINQRAVVSPVALAAGAYGHDRWKAGAGGCTYSWATSNGLTTITITAGSLIQVIEGSNLTDGAATTHVLSWTGTAQGKIGGGAYSSTGVTGAVAGGANLNIEFNTGTLAKPKLETGSVATLFERRLYATEQALCQRYYEVGTVRIDAYQGAGNPISQTVKFSTRKRAVPTIAWSGTGYFNASSIAATATVDELNISATVTALGWGAVSSGYSASCEL